MCKSVFVMRPRVRENLLSLSLIQKKSCWSFTTCRDETPRKQRIAEIICGAYDSSRRIYVKWNPSSDWVEGRLVSCVSDFPTVSTHHLWSLYGGGCHVRASCCWRWPSGVLTSLSCAHAWDVGVLVWEKGWGSIRLNVCGDEINPTVCKRPSETDDVTRVCAACGVILQSFSQPPYWKYHRTERFHVPYPGCFWRCPPRSCVPFRNSLDATGDDVLICCMTLMAMTHEQTKLSLKTWRLLRLVDNCWKCHSIVRSLQHHSSSVSEFLLK